VKKRSNPVPTVKKSDEATKVPHSLVSYTFKSAVKCYTCNKTINKREKGYTCRDCKICLHKGCKDKLIENCAGESEHPSSSYSDQNSTILDSEISTDSGNSKNSENNRNNSKYGFQENVSDDEGDDTIASPTKQVNDMMGQMVVDDYPKGQANNVPLQRVANSVRRPRGPPSVRNTERHLLLHQGWLVHYTNHSEERKRYFWRLTTEKVQLYSDDHQDQAKRQQAMEIPMHDILKVEEGNGRDQDSHTAMLRIITSQTVYHVLEDTSVSQTNSSVTKWYTHFQKAMKPYQVQKLPNHMRGVGDGHGEAIARKGSFHWSRDKEDQAAQAIQDIYKIDTNDVLGAGQFGTVYSAKHRKKSFDVAIKCVDKKRFPSKENQQLRHEVTVLSGLDHPGIVKIYNMFETPNQVFVVMEKLHGDMLELILTSENGRLPESDARYYSCQIVVALRYLHKRCVVHCDLKPENVLILNDPRDKKFNRIKLCDFGFARIIGEKSFRTSVVGTPAYLAPEVLRNEGYNRSFGHVVGRCYSLCNTQWYISVQ